MSEKKEHPKGEMAYRLMVIGGGTAGLRIALESAHHGNETLLIEPGVLGGTCLNTGCIPTKAMLHAAHSYKSAKHLSDIGIEAARVSANFPKIMQRVKSIIDEGQEHIQKSVKTPHLTIVREKAVFCSPNSVIAGTREYRAEKIIICTGAKNIVVPIKGLEKAGYLCNETIFDLKELPKSVILIGGGYISMEFATFFNDLGCKVTVLERMPQVLGMLDDDVVNELLESYEDVTILTNVNIIEAGVDNTASQKSAKGAKSSAVTGKKYILHNDVRDPKSAVKKASADELFMAIGRAPNTDGLNVEAAGITRGPRANIEVNSRLQTSNPNIYAIGDVNGRAMFAHAAKRETAIALANALDGKAEEMHFDLVPWAVFTNPPVAGIGLSEKQVRDKKIPYKIMRAPFTKSGRASIIGDTRGFVKVMISSTDHTILGAVIIGPNADDLIHEFVAVMNSASPTMDTIRKAIHVHPTIAEVMESLREETPAPLPPALPPIAGT